MELGSPQQPTTGQTASHHQTIAELLAALNAMIGMTSQRELKAGDWDRIQAQARTAVANAGGYQWPPARTAS